MDEKLIFLASNQSITILNQLDTIIILIHYSLKTNPWKKIYDI
jgi:hypothetical protein